MYVQIKQVTNLYFFIVLYKHSSTFLICNITHELKQNLEEKYTYCCEFLRGMLLFSCIFKLKWYFPFILIFLLRKLLILHILHFPCFILCCSWFVLSVFTFSTPKFWHTNHGLLIYIHFHLLNQFFFRF